LAAPPRAPALASPLEDVRRIAKEDPAAVANVVKSWVAEAK
jgi:flagellar biosynthesis/type III secretory pathway M-ring protein FliF/YscJ